MPLLFQLPLMTQHSGGLFSSCVYLTGSHCKEVNLLPQNIRSAHPPRLAVQETRDLPGGMGEASGTPSPQQQLMCRCGEMENASNSWGKSGRLPEIRTIP